MIESCEIAGVKGTVAYLDGNLGPTTKEKAQFGKVILEDGRFIYVNFTEQENTPGSGATR